MAPFKLRETKLTIYKNKTSKNTNSDRDDHDEWNVLEMNNHIVYGILIAKHTNASCLCSL